MRCRRCGGLFKEKGFVIIWWGSNTGLCRKCNSIIQKERKKVNKNVYRSSSKRSQILPSQKR